ncbi:MAG: hypothetical protein ACSHWQ_01160 [Spongiibacteraceae bacterium]
MPSKLSILLILLISSLSLGSAQAAELLYFKLHNCPACQAFERQAGTLYQRTYAANIAPIRDLYMDDDDHEQRITLLGISPPAIAPTFVLMHQNRELGRIVGYDQPSVFWSSLAELLRPLISQQSNSQ